MTDAYNLAAGVTAGGIGALVELAGGPIAFVIGGIIVTAAGFAAQTLLYAAQDSDAMDEVICDLIKALKGRQVTQQAFEDAIASLNPGDDPRAIIVGVLQANAIHQPNYTFMIDCLGYAYTAAQEGAENDCCPPEQSCQGFIDFRKPLPPGVLVTKGTIDPDRGLTCTFDATNRYEARALIVLSEACQLTDYLHIRYRVGGPSDSDRTGMGYYKDDGSFCDGGYPSNFPPNQWSTIADFTPPCAYVGDLITRLVVQQHEILALGSGYMWIWGIWWSNDADDLDLANDPWID